jgi:hypothetical protein
MTPSHTALVGRATPKLPLFSPTSPASPSFACGTGVTTAVPVAALYRVSPAFYGGGPVPLFRTSLGCMRTDAAVTATAASGMAQRVSSCNDKDGNRHLQLGVVSREQQQQQQPPLLSFVEERVRRAAQTSQSDPHDPLTGGLPLLGRSAHGAWGDHARVKVARGYRSLSSPSAWHASPRRPTYDGSRYPTEVSGTGERCGAEEGEARGVEVVPLYIGAKRRRDGVHGADKAAMSWWSCPASPAVSSLLSPASPQSPAIPRITAASSTTNLVRVGWGGTNSGSNANGELTHETTLAPPPAASSIASVGPTVGVAPSPFDALLDCFTEDGTAKLGDGAAGSSAAVAAAAMAPTWLRCWGAHPLSRHLAVQLERDMDVLNVLCAAAAPTNVADGRSWTSKAEVVASDEGSRRSAPVYVGPAVATAAIDAMRGSPAAPRTLYEALLQLFDLLEQLESRIADLYTTAGGEDTVKTASASALPFPSGPPQSAKELFRAVGRQWCDVLLLRWPSELVSLGYVEWWLRHGIWESCMCVAVNCSGSGDGGESVTTNEAMADIADNVKTTEEIEAVGCRRAASRVQEKDEQRQQQQQGQHFHLLPEDLAACCSEGMQHIFDSIVDSFVAAVQALLRCRSNSSSSSAGGAGLGENATTAPRRSCAPQGSGVMHRNANATAREQYFRAGTRCRELLRVLTSLYVDPPRVLQPVLRELATTHTPTSPLSSASTHVKNERNGNAAPPARGGEENREQASRVAFPTSPGTGRTTTVAPVLYTGSPFHRTQQQRQCDERSRVRQLHYQLLYAVCRLCNEVPLPWCSAATPAPSDAENATTTSLLRYLSSASSSAGFSSTVDHAELFAAAVQLAAAIAVPLNSVQLPMKGDLLCVTSRLARQRLSLLRRGLLSEREYAVCMGHLGALLAHAT